MILPSRVKVLRHRTFVRSQQGVGLERVHLGVTSVVDSHQLVMAALLDDLAMVEHHDHVSHAHRREPMGDQQDCSTGGEFFNSFEDVVLGASVECCGWLIKDDQRCVSKERPRLTRGVAIGHRIGRFLWESPSPTSFPSRG